MGLLAEVRPADPAPADVPAVLQQAARRQRRRHEQQDDALRLHLPRPLLPPDRGALSQRQGIPGM